MSEPSTAYWRVLSLQLRSHGLSSERAPVGPGSAWWNDEQNDIGFLPMPQPAAHSQGPDPAYCS
jgi:hypothetical protein